MSTSFKELASQSNAWPFEEARKLVERYKSAPPAKGYVLFETGYGPSGLPHIGTFGEVARTTMVRHAFTTLSDIPTRLFAFSDDMDGLRKVPDNIPNKDMVTQHLGKPLTAIPDPFGTHESFGHHMNSRLKAFLDHFGFEYEFRSATDSYKSGEFDRALLTVLKHYDAVINVILPTLGEERRQTYSPFLPVDRKTGRVLQVAVVRRDEKAGTIVYKDEDGQLVETPVTGGHCKLQWKADWAMRWFALQVDYEMSGKDLIPSVELSSQICTILGGQPPEGFSYELFLDEKGQKISKSKGNGLTIDEWLRYAPPESLSYYMFTKPRAAKRLYFDVIPRAVDDYQTFLEKFSKEDAAQQLNNPVWHIHSGQPPKAEGLPSYNLLLNLAAVAHAEEPKTLWGYLARYRPDFSPQTHPFLDQLVKGAVHYYHDFIKPSKKYRAPTDIEAQALGELAGWLENAPEAVTPEDIQNEIYAIGKKYPFAELKAWFSALYETLLGQPQGPRMGSFVALYGKAETVKLIRRVLAKENLAA
ncbi:MAG: lysine--tRNA ligase [Pseudomonadota bacterium]|nr:lysine--tRNA ligase [Pseudomonadota bacterium]